MKYSSRVNPFLSRRTYNNVSKWWARSTFNGQMPLYKMAMSIAPSGTFHAKAISDYMFNRKNEGDIRLTNSYVTIETPDDISLVRVDDIIQFQGILYRVDNVSKREIAKTRENMRYPICVYVVQMTR